MSRKTKLKTHLKPVPVLTPQTDDGETEPEAKRSVLTAIHRQRLEHLMYYLQGLKTLAKDKGTAGNEIKVDRDELAALFGHALKCAESLYCEIPDPDFYGRAEEGLQFQEGIDDL